MCERRRNRHLNRWRNGTDVCIEDNGYRDTKIYATFPLYELSHRIDSLIDRNISINDIRNFKKKKRILGTANEIKFYDLKEYFSISKDQ